MDVDKTPDTFAKSALAGFYERFPHAELRFSEFGVFSDACIREPHLISSYTENLQEGNGLFDVLSLYYKDSLIASLSFFLEKNDRKKEKPDHFARIDIVIVEKGFRKMGIGKLLVCAAVNYLLDRWSAHIYSISCLAAHDAMATILEDIGFRGEQWPKENFKRETVSFSDIDQNAFASRVSSQLERSIQLVRYRLRQPEPTSGP